MRCTLGLALAASLSSVAAETTIIARAGDQLPGLPGGTVYSTLLLPSVDNLGNVSFSGLLSGPGITESNNAFLFSAGGILVRDGTQAPTLPAGVVLNGSDIGFYAFAAESNGHIAYLAALSGPGISAANDISLWRDGALLAREGSLTNAFVGVSHGNFSNLDMNSSGELTYIGTLSGTGVTTANDTALWRDTTVIAREGSQATGLASGVVFSSFLFSAIGDGSHVLHTSQLTGGGTTTANDGSIWLNSTLIAREGNQAPTLSGITLDALTTERASVNASGQVAYKSFLLGTGIVATNNEAIWRDSTIVAREGNQAPSLASGITFGALSAPSINRNGQVSYLSGLLGTTVTFDNDQALWRDSTLIVREGNATPLAGIQYSQLSSPIIIGGGQVVFESVLKGAGINSSNDRAIWLADNEQALLVGRGGTFFGFPTIERELEFDSANDFGQVAFWTDDFTISLFTPELHWRRNFSSSWSTAGNWTVGLAPGQVHDTFIDPANSLTVTGPSAATTVASLQIGGGSGIATLSLAGGPLMSLAGTTVETTGVLTGDGILSGTVVNFGTVRAQNLSLPGALANHGLVTGNGRLYSELDNALDGDVRVGLGEALRITGTSHRNDGRIEVTDGTFEIDGSLTQRNGSTSFLTRSITRLNGELVIEGGARMSVDKGTLFANASFVNEAGAELGVSEATVNVAGLATNAGGRILLDDATLRFNGGLSNTGQVNITFGESSLFGAIDNLSGGRIVMSGASSTTFYDDLVNAAGAELRVSTGSTAVFFGKVSGGGSFSGGGTKFYENAFEPGASPAWVIDDGDVGFGSLATLEIELAGLVPGLEYDRVGVNGTLELDGTLAIVLLDGYAPSIGDSFDILDWGNLLGAFAAIDTSAAALAGDRRWNFDRLYTDGSISVVSAVPVPPALLLLASALAGLPLLRRRGGRAA